MCPKCQRQMVSVNRHGIRIEQCEGCRGIFLDRGELEQIVDAEQRHYGAGPQYAEPPHYGGPPPPYAGRPDSPPPYYGGHAPRRGGYYADSPPPYGGRRRRRRSFLEELFD